MHDVNVGMPAPTSCPNVAAAEHLDDRKSCTLSQHLAPNILFVNIFLLRKRSPYNQHLADLLVRASCCARSCSCVMLTHVMSTSCCVIICCECCLLVVAANVLSLYYAKTFILKGVKANALWGATRLFKALTYRGNIVIRAYIATRLIYGGAARKGVKK